MWIFSHWPVAACLCALKEKLEASWLFKLLNCVSWPRGCGLDSGRRTKTRVYWWWPAVEWAVITRVVSSPTPAGGSLSLLQWQARERERQETGGETMSCFLSSCDITMFVVLWLCHNKPCRFLYIAFPKYKVTDFKMWMVLPGWQIKNLLEPNNICGSWYTCTTRLSSHRRAGVENYFFPILVFKFLLNYTYF